MGNITLFAQTIAQLPRQEITKNYPQGRYLPLSSTIDSTLGLRCKRRILYTQKAITTEADNALGERVEMRLRSAPTDRAAELYRALRYTPMPFRRYHIQTSNPPPEKTCNTHTKIF